VLSDVYSIPSIASGNPACYSNGGMKKPEMAKRLARRSGVSAAQAADRLDEAVYQILRKLRRGQEAPLPGLGKFRIGPDGRIRFSAEPKESLSSEGRSGR
jgi:hypothetical protein